MTNVNAERDVTQFAQNRTVQSCVNARDSAAKELARIFHTAIGEAEKRRRGGRFTRRVATSGCGIEGWGRSGRGGTPFAWDRAGSGIPNASRTGFSRWVEGVSPAARASDQPPSRRSLCRSLGQNHRPSNRLATRRPGYRVQTAPPELGTRK